MLLPFRCFFLQNRRRFSLLAARFKYLATTFRPDSWPHSVESVAFRKKSFRKKRKVLPVMESPTAPHRGPVVKQPARDSEAPSRDPNSPAGPPPPGPRLPTRPVPLNLPVHESGIGGRPGAVSSSRRSLRVRLALSCTRRTRTLRSAVDFRTTVSRCTASLPVSRAPRKTTSNRGAARVL